MDKENSIVRKFNSPQEFLQSQKQKKVFDEELIAQVRSIILQVQQQGDQALRELSEKFDGVNRNSLAITPEEWQKAQVIGLEITDVFNEAAANIRQFHQNEMENFKNWRRKSDGGVIGQKMVPIERVGVYVPGGTAIYPSSVLMNVIPAQVAGVKEIVLVSPPDKKTGSVHPLVLIVANLLGIEEIYAIGGAQAIAALAFGTATIRPVDKITGPGNRYVAEAKRQVFGLVGIDAIAGPSEIVILADRTANPAFIAADLLSQAEHDEFAWPILISTEDFILAETEKELAKQLSDLPRQKIARSAVKNFGAFVKIENLPEGIELINRIAPEHLEIQTKNPGDIFEKIKNVGAVFLGDSTPEAVGDYWAGSNHILPTAGNARFASALSVRDFLRWISIVEYLHSRLIAEGAKIARFARLEGFEAHARSIEIRWQQNSDNSDLPGSNLKTKTGALQ